MQRNVTRTLLLALLIFGCAPKIDISSLFTEAGVKGTMVISNLDDSKRFVHDAGRADLAMLPASTFKIANSLIALDAGVISGPDEIIPWDGTVRFLDAWNQDQTMRSAFPISCVWFYQELARRVGNDRYVQYLKSLNYGNALTGEDVSTFWLKGDLRISAQEQIQFLKRLYRHDLPFSEAQMDLVKELMVIDSTSEYTLRVKTGWAVRVDDQIGWYVGWLETREDVWFFAMNMDIVNDTDARFRKDLTIQALQLLGLL
jgi:beta-lactamase class D